MEIIYRLNDLIIYPLHYLLWWFFFSWLIWLLLRWRNWTRPTLSTMLIYSAAVGIFYINSSQKFEACIELCLPFFSLFPFIAAVSFWFIVLYVPLALASKTQVISEQIKRNWWIAVLMIALAVWHIPFGMAGIVRFPENFDFITSAIFFYPAMAILLPWLFWLLLAFFSWSRPALSTMFIYSISAANATMRLWFETLVYGRYSRDFFSLSLFLADVAVWFIAFYVLMKLIIRIERQVMN